MFGAEPKIDTDDRSNLYYMKLAQAQTDLAKKLDCQLRSLLAVLHRDGGQYTAEHGLQQSMEDAINKVLTAYHVVDDIDKN